MTDQHTSADSVLVEATIDMTNWFLPGTDKSEYAAGEQFTLTDRSLAEHLAGIGFIKLVPPGAAAAGPRRGKADKAEHAAPEHGADHPHRNHRKASSSGD